MLVDGVDVKEIDREDLWSRIGIIPQKAFLFSGTIAEQPSLRHADATDEELWKALEIAQGRDFVEEMEGKLEAQITQGGTNVSGGQRQRLAIARALVKRRRDLRLRRQLLRPRLQDGRPPPGRARRASSAEATVIIVAQRVGTIMQADQIIVHRRGPDRRHRHPRRAPRRRNETYREIVYSQLSEAEAAA